MRTAHNIFDIGIKHFKLLLSSDWRKRSCKERTHGQRKVMYFGNQSESFVYAVGLLLQGKLWSRHNS